MIASAVRNLAYSRISSTVRLAKPTFRRVIYKSPILRRHLRRIGYPKAFIMAVAMVAMLAFGGTFAYFTATTTEKSGTATTGTVQLGANTMATLVADKVVSGQQLFDADSKVQVTSQSNVDTWVFITFSATMDGGTLVDSLGEMDAEGEYYLEISQASGWTPVDGHGGVLGRKVTAAEANTPIDVCTGIKFYGMSASTESAVGTIMNKTITVTITSEAIQAIGEDDGAEMTAKEAYEVLHQVGG